MDMAKIRNDVKQAAEMLIEVAEPARGEIMVLGASTSEIQGENIGSSGNDDIARAVFDTVYEVASASGVHVAVQCCEHLNRVLVVESELVREYDLSPVTVIPNPAAGGAVAYRAFEAFPDPAVVHDIRGHLGMDIGDTFIGMHLRPVAVPVRIHTRSIGHAHLTMARTRPPLVGGARAKYPEDRYGKRVRYPDCST